MFFFTLRERKQLRGTSICSALGCHTFFVKTHAICAFFHEFLTNPWKPGECKHGAKLGPFSRFTSCLVLGTSVNSPRHRNPRSPGTVDISFSASRLSKRSMFLTSQKRYLARCPPFFLYIAFIGKSRLIIFV